MTIGKRIAEKRKVKGFKQADLARETGVSTAFISQIESDVRKPSYGLLIKIAHELQASVESLLSGEAPKTDDPLDRLLFSLFPFLESDKKSKIIDYACLVSGSKFYKEIPFFTSPTEYAQYLIKDCKIKDIPVDVFRIAERLSAKIIMSKNREYEGVLYKSSGYPLIELNPDISFVQRQKFTLAMLLGHLVLPWHTKQTFCRVKEKKSLDHDDPFEMEARQFAGELLLPGSIVKKDFKKLTPSIELFENVAYKKYECSMTTLAHKYIEYYGSRAVYITSDEAKFTRKYENGFPFKLAEGVKEGSIAYSFIKKPPVSKEIRQGVVDGKIWFKDIPEKSKIFEESMLDPKFGITVTLLQINKGQK